MVVRAPAGPACGPHPLCPTPLKAGLCAAAAACPADPTCGAMLHVQEPTYGGKCQPSGIAVASMTDHSCERGGRPARPALFQAGTERMSMAWSTAAATRRAADASKHAAAGQPLAAGLAEPCPLRHAVQIGTAGRSRRWWSSSWPARTCPPQPASSSKRLWAASGCRKAAPERSSESHPLGWLGLRCPLSTVPVCIYSRLQERCERAG